MSTVLMMGTSALGSVMSLVMLFLPGATVLPWCARIPTAIVAAIFVALTLLVVGFVLANVMNWPLSQSIGGVGTILLAISHVLAPWRRRAFSS
jgi:ABC-type Mn2+/Zn2+ transport system permease subunit